MATTADQQSLLLSQLRVLQDAKNDEAKNRAIINNVARQLPPTVDEPGLLLLITNAASRATLPLTQFTPGTPIPDTTGLSEIPVTFAVTGTYFSLAQFLFNLETLPRVAKVQNVTITTGADANNSASAVPTLSMTGSVTLFTTDANAGPGSQPGPTTSGGTAVVVPSLPPATTGGHHLAEQQRVPRSLTMPITERDKRTLIIGSGTLGAMLLLFLLYNLLAGGGGGRRRSRR